MATTLEEVQQLQRTYCEGWRIRVSRGTARATRRRLSLTDAELSAGLAMTLYDGDAGSLADQLEKQTKIEEGLLSPTP